MIGKKTGKCPFFTIITLFEVKGFLKLPYST